MTTAAEVARLVLKIERALLARTHLQELLTAADETVERHQRELRELRARLALKSAGRIPE